jgi:RNA polymerase sigma factor (sigma-70 family)
LHKESKELISRAVQRLPEQQRAVYNLYHEQGFSYEKIAEQMGLSKNTVRNHMARANQSIRDYLSGHAEGLLLLVCLIDLLLPS